MGDSEILSSEEAAALREPLPAGSPADIAGQVRHLLPDDWERIAPDQQPALESLAERMAGLFGTSLRRYFRQPVEISAGLPATMKWGQLLRTLPVPCCLGPLELRPLQLRSCLVLDGELVFSLVDAFFGGNGQEARSAESSDFTQMELRLVRRLAATLAQDLQEAWRPFIELEFAPGEPEVNPLFAGIAASADLVSAWRFEVSAGQRRFSLGLVLPAQVVDTVRSLTDAGRGTGNHDSTRWRTRLKNDVEGAQVRLRAVLARTEISLRELGTARPGDIIPIEIPASVVLYAGEQALMEGSFGVHQGRNAVRITKPAPRGYRGENHE